MRRLDSPTAELLAIFGFVYVIQQVASIVGLGVAWFALAAPAVRPWTLVTGVYAHASLGHLLVNAVALALVGFAVERFTTRIRFHAFVLVTGMLAGLLELYVSDLVGPPVAVIGASGAILALYGYVVAGNPLTGGLLNRLNLSRRGKVVLVVVVAFAVTFLTAAPGVALIAHFAGFIFGLIAGRFHVLDTHRRVRREYRRR